MEKGLFCLGEYLEYGHVKGLLLLFHYAQSYHVQTYTLKVLLNLNHYLNHELRI